MPNQENVYLIRTKAGEDIVSEIYTKNDGRIYTLHSPMRVVYIPDYNPTSNQFGLTLAPWFYPSVVATQTFEISWQEILTCTKPSKTVYKMYLRSLDFYLNPKSKAKNLDDASRSSSSEASVKDDEREKSDSQDDILNNLDDAAKEALQNFVDDQLARIKKNGGKLH